MSSELSHTQTALESAERDLVMITEDTKEIRISEQHLREERAKILSVITCFQWGVVLPVYILSLLYICWLSVG